MSNTAEILQSISRGTEARLFADQFAVQIAKNGLYIFGLLCAVAAVLMMFNLLAASKKGVGQIIMIAIAGISSYFLFDKASGYNVLDDQKPVIAITPTTLEYDIRRDGWRVPWAAIERVEDHTTVREVKQGNPEVTHQVRVYIRKDREQEITWKYEPSLENNIAASKDLLRNAQFLIVDPTPLGVDSKLMADALERCRN